MTFMTKSTDIEKGEIGVINKGLESLRLGKRRMELDGAAAAEIAVYEQEALQQKAELEASYAVLQQKLEALYEQSRRDSLVVVTAEGKTMTINLSQIVHAYQPNSMSFCRKLAITLAQFTRSYRKIRVKPIPRAVFSQQSSGPLPWCC